jgi:hypothetical protein
MPAVPYHDIYQVRGLRVGEDFGWNELFGVLRKIQAHGKTAYAFRFDQVHGDQCITVFVTRNAYKKWTREQQAILSGAIGNIDPIHEILCYLDYMEFEPAAKHPWKHTWRGIRISIDDDDDEGPYPFSSKKDVFHWVHDSERYMDSFVLMCFLPPHRRSTRSRPCRHLLTYEQPGAPTNKWCIPPLSMHNLYYNDLYDELGVRCNQTFN